jgi:ATP-dependent DNA ligase
VIALKRSVSDAVSQRRHDLEGIVAKWKRGRYHSDGQTTSWLKVRNPDYSQMEVRHDAFALRRSAWSRSRSAQSVLCPDLAAWKP